MSTPYGFEYEGEGEGGPGAYYETPGGPGSEEPPVNKWGESDHKEMEVERGAIVQDVAPGIQVTHRVGTSIRRNKSRTSSFIEQAGPYHDDQIFDNIKQYIPDAKQGRWLLAAILILEVVLVVGSFMAHHHKTKDYDCCNMWAVSVAALFLAFQVPYFTDWSKPKYGYNAQWHRGNLFVPFLIMIVCFWEWGTGFVSLMAQAIEVEVFEWVNVTSDNLAPLEILSFLVCTCTGVAVMFLLFVIDYTHRNNIGNHYYYQGEESGSLVEVLDKPVRNKGIWKTNFMRWVCTLLLVETSQKAENNLPRLISLATFLQIPFYVFAMVAYTQGRRSTIAPVVIIAFGLLNFIFNWQYFIGAITHRSKKTRHWNRVHLLFPSKVLFVVNVVYFITMSNMFFSSSDRKDVSGNTVQGKDLWEAFEDLSPLETFYLYFNGLIMFALFILLLLLTAVHRKVWSEERDHGKGIRDPVVVRAESAIFGVSLDDGHGNKEPEIIDSDDEDTKIDIPEQETWEHFVADEEGNILNPAPVVELEEESDSSVEDVGGDKSYSHGAGEDVIKMDVDDEVDDEEDEEGDSSEPGDEAEEEEEEEEEAEEEAVRRALSYNIQNQQAKRQEKRARKAEEEAVFGGDDVSSSSESDSDSDLLEVEEV